MSETTKAIAKAVEATADAVKPLTTVTGRILANLMEEPSKEFGGLLADRLRARRIENLRRIAALATEKLDERGLLDAPIPLGFLGPAMTHMADVDEPPLQQRWAELIANGAQCDEHRHPFFAQTLASMDGRDAQVFEFEVRAQDGSPTLDETAVGAEKTDYSASLGRLFALLVLERNITSIGKRPWRKLTPYGRQFARAVGILPPEPDPIGQTD